MTKGTTGTGKGSGASGQMPGGAKKPSGGAGGSPGNEANLPRGGSKGGC
ncbi:MAG: hypothetical protein R3D60_10395 [Paracoccaceae bacterium]